MAALLRTVRKFKTQVLEQPRAALSRIRVLYRQGGIREVARGIRDFATYEPTLEYRTGRVDNDDRWRVIQSQLQTEYDTLLDIGCADGYFVGRAAEASLDALGLDQNHDRLEEARRRLGSTTGVEFRHQSITPTSVDELPETDVTLFLTVHHHWVRQFGWDAAADMFRTVCDRADLVAYEPPGNLAVRTGGDIDPSASETYYRDVLDDLFGDEVDVLATEMVAYTGGDRSDPLFVLDTSNYSLAD